MSIERLYHLFIPKTDGSHKQLTGYPMTHAECCTMKSKFGDYDQARIIFVEFDALAHDAAVIRDELARLKAENETLKAKLSRMCCDA